MNSIIRLLKPFKLQNDKEIKELTLDFESLTAADFRQVRKLESQVSDISEVSIGEMLKSKALSFEFQLATGFLAAVRGTDGLQVSDFLNLSMQDALELAQHASFFWLNVE